MLLKNGLLACFDDGTVTYSSSSMSHLQNEYLVQSTVKSLLEEEKLVVRSVPLGLVAECLPEICFYRDSKLGQLIVPSLGQNFGPRYTCKLIVSGRQT